MVTLYRENRIDKAEHHQPEDLATAFLATLRGEIYPDYQPSGSWRIDDQFIWWLGDSKAMNATWMPEDWPAMINALDALMDADESARRTILDVVTRRQR